MSANSCARLREQAGTLRFLTTYLCFDLEASRREIAILETEISKLWRRGERPPDESSGEENK
jgi:hypothetical protein